ncbi:MAG: hypothetical protein J3K34DRAFT_457943 [Monoraphidium minutum]|nr:MAG: hypothetical protein J3K34DRAFT_457943 [Monoraphidium minutum]
MGALVDPCEAGACGRGGSGPRGGCGGGACACGVGAATPFASALPAPASTLPFSFEGAAQGAAQPSPPRAGGAAGAEYDASLEIERLRAALRPATDAHVQLAAAVAACRPAPRASDAAALWELGRALRGRFGYPARVRTCQGPRRASACASQLRRAFLVVRCGGAGGRPLDCIVDLGFRYAFAHAKARPWYRSLLAALPQDFVGPADALALVLAIMASAGRALFQELRLPLPPWREPRAVLSRWLPAGGEGCEDADVPLPPPGAQFQMPSAPNQEPASQPAAAPCFGSPASAGAGAGSAAAAPRPASAAAAAFGPRFASDGGGAGPRCRRVDDDSVPHVVIFGFAAAPGAEHRLRRSSAPAGVGAASAAGAGAAGGGGRVSLSGDEGDGCVAAGGGLPAAANATGSASAAAGEHPGDEFGGGRQAQEGAAAVHAPPPQPPPPQQQQPLRGGGVPRRFRALEELLPRVFTIHLGAAADAADARRGKGATRRLPKRSNFS